jgi:DNA-binding NarL/FixJ family response regulator
MTADVVRTLLADDEDLVRAGLRALVDGHDDITVVGEARDGAEVLSATRALRPDVVCMDVRMPGVDGIQATRTLTARHPEVKVLVLTTFENDDYVHDALLAGAQGFLLKRAAPESLVAAIHTVHRGESLLFPDALRRVVARATPVAGRPGLPMLTEREGDVLRLIAAGLSNAEIAARLYVTVETVKTHVARILAKLGVRDRVQAVIRAYETGFVSPS